MQDACRLVRAPSVFDVARAPTENPHLELAIMTPCNGRPGRAGRSGASMKIPEPEGCCRVMLTELPSSDAASPNQP